MLLMRSYLSSGKLLHSVVRFVPDEPCLVIDGTDDVILLAADLHIGFEKELANRGINIMSQTAKLLAKMTKIVKRLDVTKVILLGDVKHGTSKILNHEWSDIPEFFEGLQKVVDRVEIVPGNHDGGLKHLLPNSIVIHSSQGVVISAGGKRIAMTHGHAWPPYEAFFSDCLIVGHHHFTYELRDPSGLRTVEPAWLISNFDAKAAFPSFLKAHGDSRTVRSEGGKRGLRKFPMVVLPAFNSLLGGFPVNRSLQEDYLGPLFRPESVNMNEAEVILMDGTFMGRLEKLRSD